jgi:hypothetical protein
MGFLSAGLRINPATTVDVSLIHSEDQVGSFGGLAIGAPHKSDDFSGGVVVLYSDASSLATSGSQFFDQDTPGTPDYSEIDDYYGYALAAGDLNCDGYNDLAVGIPNKDIYNEGNAGGITILYGSHDGLSAAGSQWFDQENSEIVGSAEGGDIFGRSLATGDINADGCDDLAVGAPGETVGSASNAGGVNILYGSAQGLSPTGSHWFDQNNDEIYGTAEAFDHFGTKLAFGDLNDDSYADLVIGTPFEQVGAAVNAGGFTVLYGTSKGLTAVGSLWISQDTPETPGSAETDDLCGSSLAAGDLNGDGYDDLVVGSPGETVGTAQAAGGINVFYGSKDGLNISGSQWFDQRTPGLPGTSEFDDNFGHSLAVGDYDNDGFADLVVGVPRKQIDNHITAGGVVVMYGSSEGLSTLGSQWFDQDNQDISGSAGDYENFGIALAAGRLNSDRYADLVVGVPYEAVDGEPEAGGVNVLYGSADGLSPEGSQWFDQNTPGIPGRAENDDRLGYSLAVWGTPQVRTFLPLLSR